MKRKLLFLLNPFAGKAEIKGKLLEIVDLFVKGGYEVTVHPTQGSTDALLLAQHEAAEFDRLVCSGGDGTLNETINGLMRVTKKRPLLGYIPAGTVNDFARSLCLPRMPLQAARIALEGRPFWCDIGRFAEEKYFAYIAAFGAFTDVSYQTPQQAKNLLGRAAYLLEGAKRVGSLQPFRLRIEYDAGGMEGDFAFGMVTNATSVGGFKELIQKDVSMDDGLFEVTLIRMPQSAAELQRIINSLLLSNPDRSLIHFFKTGSIAFHAEQQMPWTLDGEFGGYLQEVLIENCKQKLEILIDSKKFSC